MSTANKIVHPPGTLEYELSTLLGSIRPSPRQERALSARLGWNGSGTTTLAVAARSEGYSRERVRQLESRLRESLADLRVETPSIREAILVIERSAPDSRAHIAEALAAAGLAATRFDPTGVLAAGALTGINSDAFVADGLVLLRSRRRAADEIFLLARRLTSRNGATSVQQLAAELGEPPDRIRRLLAFRPEVGWLDDQKDWLQAPKTAGRTVTILRKMLAVSDSLTITSANDGLRRAVRPVSVPADVLRQLCESLAWLKVDRERQRISSDPPLEQDAVLSPVERGLVSIFHTAGPVVTFSRALELGLRLGLNRNSIAGYLSHSPILQTLTRGRYALRGWTPETAG